MTLFKKAAVFTDIHFGGHNNSDLHNNDCLEFMYWFVDMAYKNDCDTCIFLGDYHNNRHAMNIKTMKYIVQGMELLNKNFDHIYFIPGNHDHFFKDKRSTFSTPWANHLSNMTIVNDWIVKDDVVFAPWLIGEDHQQIEQHSGKYIFGHFELPGFFMNSQIKMPDTGIIKNSQFKNYDHCFTGHFHKRQTSKNITYIGNAFPHNYSDAGDDERGMMILPWGSQPEYYTWPDQPTFRYMTLSNLLEHPELLKKNMHIKATLDLDITFNDSALIKEQFMMDYGLRELVFVPQMASFNINEQDTSNIIEPVDKTIATQLNNIESDKFDKSLLLDIWKEL